LKKAAALNWIDVSLVRINPQGREIDTPDLAVFTKSNELNVPAVVEQLKIKRNNGHGIIGMKLIAQGQFADIEDRQKSLAWVMQTGITDAVVIGMKNRAEIDEAIPNISNGLRT
jgi:aryl-alcohol dehydrogenase-like predicted oxidoreductase